MERVNESSKSDVRTKDEFLWKIEYVAAKNIYKI